MTYVYRFKIRRYVDVPKYAILFTCRTKLENVKLREDLGRQNKKLEEMFEVLQKQIQNLARNLDKQVAGRKNSRFYLWEISKLIKE